MGAGADPLFPAPGLDLPCIDCALCHAMIAPTDPIGALDVLKNARAPRSPETNTNGETAFEDGIAMATCLILIAIAGTRKQALHLAGGAAP